MLIITQYFCIVGVQKYYWIESERLYINMEFKANLRFIFFHIKNILFASFALSLVLSWVLGMKYLWDY